MKELYLTFKAHTVRLKEIIFWGFVRNLKVSARNKQLLLMKVYRYLSQKKITSLIPSSLGDIQTAVINRCLFFVNLEKHLIMDMQAEKLKLIEWLKSLSDQSIIEKLKLFKENLLEKSDWWETLTDDEIKSIDEGLNDIKEGRVTPHSEVMKKYGKSA